MGLDLLQKPELHISIHREPNHRPWDFPLSNSQSMSRVPVNLPSMLARGSIVEFETQKLQNNCAANSKPLLPGCFSSIDFQVQDKAQLEKTHIYGS